MGSSICSVSTLMNPWSVMAHAGNAARQMNDRNINGMEMMQPRSAHAVFSALFFAASSSQSWATREPCSPPHRPTRFGTARAQASSSPWSSFQCRTESRQSRDAQADFPERKRRAQSYSRTACEQAGSSDIQCPVSMICHAFHYAALRLKVQAPHSLINGKRERQTAHSALQCR